MDSEAPGRPLQKPRTELERGEGSGGDRRERNGSFQDIFIRCHGQVLA